jgi:hypothetical protein
MRYTLKTKPKTAFELWWENVRRVATLERA